MKRCSIQEYEIYIYKNYIYNTGIKWMLAGIDDDGKKKKQYENQGGLGLKWEVNGVVLLVWL